MSAESSSSLSPKCDLCFYTHVKCTVQPGSSQCDKCVRNGVDCRTTVGRPPIKSKKADGTHKNTAELFAKCMAINNRRQNTTSDPKPENLTTFVDNMAPTNPINSSRQSGQQGSDSHGQQKDDFTSSHGSSSMSTPPPILPGAFLKDGQVHYPFVLPKARSTSRSTANLGMAHQESSGAQDKGKGKAATVEDEVQAPKQSRAERRAAEQKEKKALKKGGAQQKIPAGNAHMGRRGPAQTQRVETPGIALPSRRRGVFNMVANPILEPLRLRDGTFPPQTSAHHGTGQHTPPISQAGVADGASTSQSKIMCCSGVKTKVVGISSTSTFVQFVKNVAGQFPDRTIDADKFQIPWKQFDYIFGLITYILDDKKKFIGKTQYYGIKNEPSICGRFKDEVMEIVGTKAVGLPPVVSAYDTDDHKNECLVRMSGESSRNFICNEHLPKDSYYVVFVCTYHPGDDAEEAAAREEEERRVLETIAALEKIEKQNPGTVYGGVMQTVAMVTALSEQDAGENNHCNGNGHGGVSIAGGDNGHEIIDLTGGDGDSSDMAGGDGGSSYTAGGDGGSSYTAGGDGGSTAAGEDDEMAWLKDVVYSESEGSWKGGVVSSNSDSDSDSD